MPDSTLVQLVYRHCAEEDALMERMLRVQGYGLEAWQTDTKQDPYHKYVGSKSTRVEHRLALLELDFNI